ncbi:MAG: single-stranded DNA-binding protein [Chloroflexota bacterium]
MARGLNKVMLIGNVGRDPEMRFTASGKPVTSFSVAVSRRWKASDGQRREETEWFNIVAWGNLAEICDRYVSKSQQIYVEGRLQTRSWENDQGIRQFRTDVIANEVTVLEPRHRERNVDDDIDGFTEETTFANEDHSENSDSFSAKTEEVEPTF